VEHGPPGGRRDRHHGGEGDPGGGDIILSVEDIPVVSEENIEKVRNTLATLASVAPGAAVKMNVLRAGKIIELTGTSR
jgi:S1-C subfamily serine protease